MNIPDLDLAQKSFVGFDLDIHVASTLDETLTLRHTCGWSHEFSRDDGYYGVDLVMGASIQHLADTGCEA